MYSIKLTEIAADFIAKLDSNSQRQILEKIEILKTEPLKLGKPLKGNLKGVLRYRVGDYRLFADIQDDKLVIFLFEVAHRKEIYK